jgi:hypothetical protein
MLRLSSEDVLTVLSNVRPRRLIIFQHKITAQPDFCRDFRAACSFFNTKSRHSRAFAVIFGRPTHFSTQSHGTAGLLP